MTTVGSASRLRCRLCWVHCLADDGAFRIGATALHLHLLLLAVVVVVVVVVTPPPPLLLLWRCAPPGCGGDAMLGERHAEGW